MRPDLVSLLRCPHCGRELSIASRALKCTGGHSFDMARQGYVNLIAGSGQSGTADTAEMVAARDSFLTAGHFAGLRDAVADAAERVLTVNPEREPSTSRGVTIRGHIIDVGAGTGYYLDGILERFPEHVGLALDVSKFATRRAAKTQSRLGAVVCDTWARLPIRDQCADLVLDIFAPRNASEFRRVLQPGGRLIVVTPTERHLAELVPPLGLIRVDPRKQERLEEKLASHFKLADAEVHEETLSLAPGEIATLVAMGPSSRHLQYDELNRRIAGLVEAVPGAGQTSAVEASGATMQGQRQPPAISATLSAVVSVYRPA